MMHLRNSAGVDARTAPPALSPHRARVRVPFVETKMAAAASFFDAMTGAASAARGLMRVTVTTTVITTTLLTGERRGAG